MIRILEGDCLALLPTIEAGSVRLAFADPPYNIGVDYGPGEKADRLPPAEYYAWCRRWIGEAARLLTPDGSLWILINHERAARVEVMLEDAGLAMRDWITWYESFGVNCSTKFNRTSRRLLHAVRDPKRFVFHRGPVSRPSDRQAKYGDKRAAPGGKVWDDVWGINPAIPRVCGTFRERIPEFPTQLPLQLLRAVIGCASDPGDLVLDPFSGSGTTAHAAAELGRRFIGVEKSPVFAKRSRSRVSTLLRTPPCGVTPAMPS